MLIEASMALGLRSKSNRFALMSKIRGARDKWYQRISLKHCRKIALFNQFHPQ